VAYGPVFSYYLQANQLCSTYGPTALKMAGREFDADNCYNAITGVFAPTRAGYYQINAHAQPIDPADSNIVAIYKNGALYKLGTSIGSGGTITTPIITSPTTVATSNNTVVTMYDSHVSTIVYMNGTTDQLTIQATATFPTGTTGYFKAGIGNTYFNGHWIRP
jgi:hypothetical protein